jgi:DAACS family dicarboxylate/amino acid:cation (Na+ or H+) symporter
MNRPERESSTHTERSQTTRPRLRPLAILLGLTIGAVLGLLSNAIAPDAGWLVTFIEYVAGPLGQIFIRLLLVLVIPIVFAALVMGVAELELRHLGRLGLKTLVLTVVFSTLAVVIGLALVNLLAPGRGLPELMRETARSVYSPAAVPDVTSPIAFIVGIVPNNPLRAAADGDMLAVIFVSLLFGIGLATTRTPAAAQLRTTIEGLFDVMMRLIEGVLRLAPIGVGALMFTMTARVGLELLAQLAAYVGVVVLGLGIQLLVVYSVALRFVARTAVTPFFRGIRLAMATAFSTASSNATLPTALRVAEDNLRLPRHVSRFVLTAGATMNQNGTALFEGVTVLFLAQVYQVELGLAQQALVMGICILAGIGTAGVPAGSLPVIAMILTLLGIPAEGLGLVLGVDRFLDMCRTTLNVSGDLVIAACVSRGEAPEPAHSPALS